jgi:DnaJ-class molecular chaperone
VTRFGFIFENVPGYGVMSCPGCGGRGHRVGAATTTAAECWTCQGRGSVQYSPPRATLTAPERETDNG